MTRSLYCLALIILGFAVITGVANGEEIAPLPELPSTASVQRIAWLSLSANSQTPVLGQEAEWRRVAAKRTVSVFKRQGRWPLRVQTSDGHDYWGDITGTASETFDLLNRQTNQTVTLTYISIREMGIAKSYPRTIRTRPEEKTFQTIGVVIGIVLLLPARLLEQLLVPQC
jgi:hypothetical protein